MRQPDPTSTVMLVRACSPLGTSLAEGFTALGHRALSIASRTTTGRPASLRADLDEPSTLPRRLRDFARNEGLIDSIILLPGRFRSDATRRHDEWERDATRILVENAGVIRAAAPVLHPGGCVVLVSEQATTTETRERQATPFEAIVELGAVGVATELDVPIMRCPLDDLTTRSGRDAAAALMQAITGPRRASRGLQVRMPRGTRSPSSVHRVPQHV